MFDSDKQVINTKHFFWGEENSEQKMEAFALRSVLKPIRHKPSV